MNHSEAQLLWESRCHEKAVATMLQQKNSAPTLSTTSLDLPPDNDQKNLTYVVNGCKNFVSLHGAQSPRWEPLGGIRQVPATGLRSVAVPVSTVCYAASNDWERKIAGSSDSAGASGMPQKVNSEHSLDSVGWMPTKWSRPSSVSLVKDNGATSETEAVNSLPTLGAVSKRPRLGWGQGLAQYEKKNSQGQSNSSSSGASCVVFSGDQSSVNGLASSPSSVALATPACASERVAATEEVDCTYLEGDGIGRSFKGSFSESLYEEFVMKLHNLDADFLNSLNSMFSDISHPEDGCTGSLLPKQLLPLTKLSALKAEVSKVLEKTETEVDLLEDEQKTLTCNLEIACYKPSSFPINDDIRLRSSELPCDTPSKAFVLQECNNIGSPARDEDGIECAVRCAEDNARTALQIEYMEEVSSESRCAEESGFDSQIGLAESIEKLGVHDSVANEVHLGSSGLGLVNHCCREDMNSIMVDRECVFTTSCSDYNVNYNIVSAITTSNQDQAKRSSEALNNDMYSTLSLADCWSSEILARHRKGDLRVRGKIFVHKNAMKFKKHALIIRFMTLKHFLKNGRQSISFKRNCKKSCEHSITNKCAFRGSSSGVSAEILKFIVKSLSQFYLKPHRGFFKMPSLIIDDKERSASMFFHKSGLIDDPVSFEHEKSAVNPWTLGEKRIFMDMLATHGKDFSRIASFLCHKTTADCVEFYYKNQKSESFIEAKEKLGIRKHSDKSQLSRTFLVTSSRRGNFSSNAAVLDSICSGSVAASHNFENDQQKAMLQTAEESAAADVLVGICCSVSSESTSSCVTAFEHLGKAFQVDQQVIPDIDQDNFSDEDYSEPVDWTDMEKSNFVQALHLCGKDFVKVSNYVGTKSSEQCKIYFSKVRRCLGLDVIHATNNDVRMNGGDIMEQSYRVDTCAAEFDSAVCSSKFSSKMTEEAGQLANDTNNDVINYGDSIRRTEVHGSCVPEFVTRIKFEDNSGNLERQRNSLSSAITVCGENNLQSCYDSKDNKHVVLGSKQSYSNDRKIEGSKCSAQAVVIEKSAVSGYCNQESPYTSYNKQYETEGRILVETLKGKVVSSEVLCGTELMKRGIPGNEFSCGIISFADDLNVGAHLLDDVTMAGVRPLLMRVPVYQYHVPPPSILNQNACIPVELGSWQSVAKSTVSVPASTCVNVTPRKTFESSSMLHFAHVDEHQQKSAGELHQRLMRSVHGWSPVNHPGHILSSHPSQALHWEPQKKASIFCERYLSYSDSAVTSRFPIMPDQTMSQSAAALPAASWPEVSEAQAQVRPACWTTGQDPESHSTKVCNVKLFGKIITASQNHENMGIPWEGSENKSPPANSQSPISEVPSSNGKDLYCTSSMQCGTHVESHNRPPTCLSPLSGPITPARFRKSLTEQPFHLGKDPSSVCKHVLMDNPHHVEPLQNSSTFSAPGPTQIGRMVQFGALGNSSNVFIGNGVTDPVVALRYSSNIGLMSTDAEVLRHGAMGR